MWGQPPRLSSERSETWNHRGCCGASDQIKEYEGWSRPSGLRQSNQNRRASAPEVSTPFENHPRPLYKSPYRPSARHPTNPRPPSPTPRPHHHRRRPSSSRSSPGSALHQPPSISKPSSHGGSSRHRTSRPATATPPPSRSSSRPRP